MDLSRQSLASLRIWWETKETTGSDSGVDTRGEVAGDDSQFRFSLGLLRTDALVWSFSFEETG